MTREAVTFDIDWGTLDQIAVVSMRGHIADLEADLKRRKRGRGCAIFHSDKKTDISEIQRHINVFQTVLQYYG
jgi:hypothetical protein